MRFITGRNNAENWDDPDDLAAAPFFNLWEDRLWPYFQVASGDTLFLYRSESKTIDWETRVARILRFGYKTKGEAEERLCAFHPGSEVNRDYFKKAKAPGYCIAYTVEPVEKLPEPMKKPDNQRWPHMGWLRVDAAVSEEWLHAPRAYEDRVLDDLRSVGTASELLHELNATMKVMPPERRAAIIWQMIRRDCRIIQLLKKVRRWKCQFPGCAARIPVDGGQDYVEVAHIESVARGGWSVLRNLLVLCPNHHKEFDFGRREIIEQTDEVVSGTLNDVEFRIDCRLPGSATKR